MGLFSLNTIEKAAGATKSDSIIDRKRKVRAYLEAKQFAGETLSDSDQATLKKATDFIHKFENRIQNQPYVANIIAKRDSGEPLTNGEMKTLDGLDIAHEGVADVKAVEPTQSSAPKCPKCGSANIQLLGQRKKAFSVGKAVAGGLLTGGIGTLAGFAGKNGDYQWICMSCGERFQMK